ncbi:hypothetical protein GE09DRAFT_319738 [Coniochaeta sp. 2T2.1]|nr:hypothetical protein GE09DRAFT_319738 [Coniochaeta sp. 2T2.1]
MPHNVLITGGSGYLGGTLLNRLPAAKILPLENVYASVRDEFQAENVKKYGFKPLSFDFSDAAAITAAVVDNKITVVYFLTDPVTHEAQVNFIKALAQVKEQTGQDVHFLHTSGAKMFSSHTGSPTDRPLLDTEPDLYDIHKGLRPGPNFFKQAVATNCIVIEEGEKLGVRSYVFVPCIVYGKGEGFGNKISIQTVCIVKAAKAVGRVYKVDDGKPSWPVCHVIDNTNLYIDLLRKIVANENPSHGKNGFYLAASGSVVWDDLYSALGQGLAKRKVISDPAVTRADDETLGKLGVEFGCPPEMVAVQIGGLCTFTAENGKRLGWKPQFSPEHILEYADEEVEAILEHLESWEERSVKAGRLPPKK